MEVMYQHMTKAIQTNCYSRFVFSQFVHGLSVLAFNARP